MDTSHDDGGHEDPLVGQLGIAPDDVVLLFFRVLYTRRRFEDIHHFGSANKRLWELCKNTRAAALRHDAIVGMREIGDVYPALCAAQWRAVQELHSDFQLDLLQVLIDKVARAKAAITIVDLAPLAIGWVEKRFPLPLQGAVELWERNQSARRLLLLPLLKQVRSKLARDPQSKLPLEALILRAGGRRWGGLGTATKFSDLMATLVTALAEAKGSENKIDSLGTAFAKVVDLLPIVELKEADDAWETLSECVAEMPPNTRSTCLFFMAMHIPDLSDKKQVAAFEWVDATIKTIDEQERHDPTYWLLKSAACLPPQRHAELLQAKMQQLKLGMTAEQLHLCDAVLRTLPPNDRERGFDQMFDLALPEEPGERLECLRWLGKWLEFTSSEKRVGHLLMLTVHLQKLRSGAATSIAQDCSSIVAILVGHAPLFEPAQVPSVIPAYLTLIDDLPGEIFKMQIGNSSELLEALFAGLCIVANKGVIKVLFENTMGLVSRPSGDRAHTLHIASCAAVVGSYLHHLPPNDLGTYFQQLTDKLGVWCFDPPYIKEYDNARLSLAVDLLRVHLQHPQASGSVILAGHIDRLWRSYVGACSGPFDFNRDFVTTIAKAAYLLSEKEQRERFEALLEHMSKRPDEAGALPEIFSGCHRFTKANRVLACKRLLDLLEDDSKSMKLRLQQATILDRLLDRLPQDSDEIKALRARRSQALESEDDAAERESNALACFKWVFFRKLFGQ